MTDDIEDLDDQAADIESLAQFWGQPSPPPLPPRWCPACGVQVMFAGDLCAKCEES